MSKIDGAGWSEYTPGKQYAFRRILAAHMNTVRAILLRWPTRAFQAYCYYDLTAGWGRHPSGKAGSPAIFLDHASHFSMPYEAHLFEKGRKALPHLRTFCEGDDGLHLHEGDNRQLLDVVPEVSDAKDRFGLLYVDPNGVPPKSWFIKRFLSRPYMKKVDALLHVPAGTIKRVHSVWGDGSAQRLADYVTSLGRDHWIIREPDGSNGQQWTFLLGTNWEALDKFRRLRFHPIDSRQGRAILHELTYSASERSLPELCGVLAASDVPGDPVESHGPQQRSMRSVPPAPTYRSAPPTLPGLGDV